jgi:hypothetical protein
MTTFGAVSIVVSTAIHFIVSGFRETEAYIQVPEKQSLVEFFLWKATSASPRGNARWRLTSAKGR